MDWNLWQTKAENAVADIKTATDNIQNFGNTIKPLLELVGVQKANNSAEQIAQGNYNEPAGAAVTPSPNEFPAVSSVMQSMGVALPWIAGGALIYFLMSSKGKRR